MPQESRRGIGVGVADQKKKDVEHGRIRLHRITIFQTCNRREIYDSPSIRVYTSGKRHGIIHDSNQVQRIVYCSPSRPESTMLGSNRRTPYSAALAPMLPFYYHRNSGIYTFRISVQTHCPLLRHRRITQEIQRHPHQMSPDLIQLLLDLRNRHIKIAQVSLPRAQR